MRIAMLAAPVHPLPPTKGAAVEWWMLQTARALCREFGAQVHLIALAAPGQPAQEVIEGVHIHRIHMGRLYKRLFQKLTRLDPWPFARRVASLLARIAPDVLHVHNAPALLAALSAGSRVPALLHMHNDKPIPPGMPIRWCAAPSRYLAELFAPRMPGASLQVITNGADAALYAHARTAARAPLPAAAAGKKILLYVGRMSPEKGPLELIRAFAVLAAQRMDVFLLMAGEFSAGGPRCTRTAYGEQIRQIAAGLPHACHLMGVVPPQDIQQVYCAADLALVPSRFEEPFGMVAIEAMAAGTPVAAARRGGLVEFITHRDTGFLLDDIDTPAQLAQQLSAILDDPQTLQRVAAQGQQHALREHDWRVVAQQTHTLYQRMLAGDSGTD